MARSTPRSARASRVPHPSCRTSCGRATRTALTCAASSASPPDATVFGRHGGKETFSVDYARAAVVEVARARPDVFFLFLNTYPLHERLPNIIYLERTSDEEAVGRFIRTCDAMLHARVGGETFGLAVAEFSAHNRPVITSAEHDDHGHGRMHLDVLGAHKGLARYFYRDHASLVRLLLHFDDRSRFASVPIAFAQHGYHPLLGDVREPVASRRRATKQNTPRP